MNTRLLLPVIVAAAAAMTGCSTLGGSGSAAQAPNQEQADLAASARSVLQQQQQQPDAQRIPAQLLADARCVAVFPSIIQGGLIVGGQRGHGLIACRQQSGSFDQAAPAVYTLTGGSIGLQAGAQKRSVVLLFLTRQSVNSLLQSKLQLGSQIGVTAGPVGFDRQVGGTPAPVVAYQTSKTGLFAGVNLTGTKLSFDSASNAALYGADTSAESVLLTTNANVPSAVQPYMQTLRDFVPAPAQNGGGQGGGSNQNTGNQTGNQNSSDQGGSPQGSGNQESGSQNSGASQPQPAQNTSPQQNGSGQQPQNTNPQPQSSNPQQPSGGQTPPQQPPQNQNNGSSSSQGSAS